jgi:hypothetical protein
MNYTVRYSTYTSTKGSTTNLNQGGWDALVCQNPTPPSRSGSRVVPTVPPLEG